MIPDLAYSRLGRMVEVFDLDVPLGLPPDAMFAASPNVISPSRGWCHASCRCLLDGVLMVWDMQIPLDRWVSLTINLLEPNDDRDVIVQS